MQLLENVHRTVATMHSWNMMHFGCSSATCPNSCISQTLIRISHHFQLGQGHNLLVFMPVHAYNIYNHGIVLLLLLLQILNAAVAIVAVAIIVLVVIVVVIV